MSELAAVALYQIIMKKPDERLSDSYSHIFLNAVVLDKSPVEACLEVFNETEQIIKYHPRINSNYNLKEIDHVGSVHETVSGIIAAFERGDIPEAIAYSMFPIPNVPSAKWSLLEPDVDVPGRDSGRSGISSVETGKPSREEGSQVCSDLGAVFREEGKRGERRS